MNPIIRAKKTTPLYVLIFAVAALSPAVRAVLPPPDGGYPGGHTAEGTKSLFQSHGWRYSIPRLVPSRSLSNTNRQLQHSRWRFTRCSNNTADENTATGASALSFNSNRLPQHG